MYRFADSECKIGILATNIDESAAYWRGQRGGEQQIGEHVNNRVWLACSQTSKILDQIAAPKSGFIIADDSGHHVCAAENCRRIDPRAAAVPAFNIGRKEQALPIPLQLGGE